MAPLVIGAEPGASDSAADAAKPTASKKKYTAATPQELAGMLSFGVRGVSVLVAAWLEIEDLAMWPTEADAISRPLGNILWPYLRKYGLIGKLMKRAKGADDWRLLALALYTYGRRVAPAVAARVSSNQRPLQNEVGNGPQVSQPSRPTRREDQRRSGASRPSAPDGNAGGGTSVPSDGAAGWASLAGVGAAAYSGVSFPTEAEHFIDYGSGIQPLRS